MLNIRPLAAAALLCASAPAVGHAATAEATFDIFIDYTVTAPGATFIVLAADGGIEPFEFGTGVVDFTLAPDPFVLSDFADVEVSFGGSVMAAEEFGFAAILAGAFLEIVIANDLGTPIPVTIDYDISVAVTAEAIQMPLFFADALISIGGGVFAESEMFGEILEEGFFFEADGLSGPPFDGFAVSGTLPPAALAPGDAIFVSAGVFLDGFAEVAPIPLPAGIWFGLTGLAGLGLLRARRA